MNAVVRFIGPALHSSYGRVPVFCCVVGAAMLLAFAGCTWCVEVAAAVLVTAGLLAGASLVRRNGEQIDALNRRADADLARVLRVSGQSAQLWVRHIDSVRACGDEEVGELARLFGELCSTLDSVVGARQLGPDKARQAMLEALECNARELQGIVKALHDIQASKRQIVDDIHTRALALRGNAADIRQIALSIRTVALNATIEAARAGAAGRPFAVIVTDMRELASRTAQASERFSREAERLQQLVTAAVSDGVQGAAGSIAAAQETVRRVMEGFDATLQRLTDALAAMESERGDVRDRISRALVALQFQDRVSQILSHVSRSVAGMRDHIGDGSWGGVDEHEWLRDVAAEYSTEEEFRNHAGAAPVGQRRAAGITFF